MCIIGLDIHRGFGEAVAWEHGRLRRLGRVNMQRDRLAAFAAKLTRDDVVVIEATGNAASAAAVIAPHVAKVVIANPQQVRAATIIASTSASIRIWSTILARLRSRSPSAAMAAPTTSPPRSASSPPSRSSPRR